LRDSTGRTPECTAWTCKQAPLPSNEPLVDIFQRETCCMEHLQGLGSAPWGFLQQQVEEAVAMTGGLHASRNWWHGVHTLMRPIELDMFRNGMYRWVSRGRDTSILTMA
jgi:hypothetical protein